MKKTTPATIIRITIITITNIMYFFFDFFWYLAASSKF